MGSLGIMLMELMEEQPPYMQLPSAKALFLIVTKGVPGPKQPEKWSKELLDFLNQCTQIDPESRPTAVELLEHSFLKKACKPEELAPIIKKAHKNRDPCTIL